jgi:hypothetical protein
VRGDVLESSSIVRQMPEVVAENLFVEIPEQMKFFHANVSSFKSTLE